MRAYQIPPLYSAGEETKSLDTTAKIASEDTNIILYHQRAIGLDQAFPITNIELQLCIAPNQLLLDLSQQPAVSSVALIEL